ncbi:MAG: PIN domain-containing protein [Verrucomicrobiaceae bacterium]|nr:MAG: PIN domain-containing protein [Verrucomicrobiaceae bacterium]
MIGLDTNIIVRLLVQDDTAQLGRVRQALDECSESNPGLLNSIVLDETVWVLGSAYGYGREEIAHAVETLLQIRELEIEHREQAWEALQHYRSGNADFSDCYLGAINRKLGCTTTLTLDRKAARMALFRPV